MKDEKFIFGVTLVSLSFVAAIVSWYLLPFCLPAFAIGAVFIFLSKKSLRLKLIWALAPILLYVPTAYLFLSWYNKTTPETFFIPSDFQGKFRVIYGEKCGVEPEYKNGRRVLTIPSNGILIIQPEMEDGFINHEYFLVDTRGRKKKANNILGNEERKGKLPAVFLDGTGSFGGQMPDDSSSSESEDAIQYSDYFVLNRDTTLIENFQVQQSFDSLMNALVQECRKRKI